MTIDTVDQTVADLINGNLTDAISRLRTAPPAYVLTVLIAWHDHTDIPYELLISRLQRMLVQ